MKETPQEKMYREILSEDMRDIVQVSQSYQHYLGIVNSHLFTVYGDRADWGKCLIAYFNSKEYRRACHNGKRIGNIKTLNREDIDTMLFEEKQYSTTIDELISLYHKLEKIHSGSPEENEYIYKMANILGLLPEKNSQALYQWIIHKKGMSTPEQSELHRRIAENINLFGIIVLTLVKMFLEGFQLTFPNVGCAMTKSRSRYFYRGENAFYKSSKASVFRVDNTPSPIKPIVDHLRLDECSHLLDQFDAVKHWSYSGVNYLALAQHYGLKTQMIDITSSLKTALFFACCKFGSDHKWYPLQKAEIEYINSRKYIAQQGGGSRYGILYRTPSEITEMKWALANKDAGWEIITPVGYQPFMRCSQQDAYMIIAKDGNYNLLNDPMFDIYKIPLDEDLCEWIYEEMDGGKMVFPQADVPDISKEIEAINDQKVFSETVFQHFSRARHLNSENLRHLLSQYGFVITGKASPISSERLAQINSQYTITDAMDKIGIKPLSSPLLSIPSDTLVNEDGTLVI